MRKSIYLYISIQYMYLSIFLSPYQAIYLFSIILSYAFYIFESVVSEFVLNTLSQSSLLLFSLFFATTTVEFRSENEANTTSSCCSSDLISMIYWPFLDA